ncbi:MAG TPA: hypothetical protein VGP96_10210 [Candidatus Dormibacteraeota bacterium]|nr:hypothetical protein [Candidatus Dormibacteraeota bacterium]
MTESSGGPPPDWHREIAAATFNRTWELIDLPQRSHAEEDEMLRTAVASRHHWEQAGGGDAERATGDWQIAHVAALLGLPDLSLRCARSALDIARAGGWTGWRLASCHEGMARAHAAAGHRSERDRHIALARRALAEVDDPEAREAIEAQLATVP